MRGFPVKQNKLGYPMAKIKIDRAKCKGCELCIIHCPKGLLALEKTLNKQGVYPVCFKAKPKVECSGCKFCVLVCPDSCIEIYKETD